MQRNKSKWRVYRSARAVNTVSEIEVSIVALDDEDLLDLHDIFAKAAASALGTLARIIHR